MLRLVTLILFVITGASAGTCPESHPYNYNGGNHCCKYGREKVYGPQGWRCDGGPISRRSSCCMDDAHHRCNSPPCDDYLVGRDITECKDALQGDICANFAAKGHCTTDAKFRIRCAKTCNECGTCPESHPYNYNGGNHCCKYNREKVYRPQGRACDGSPISRQSTCCKNDDHYTCTSRTCYDFPGARPVKERVKPNRG